MLLHPRVARAGHAGSSSEREGTQSVLVNKTNGQFLDVINCGTDKDVDDDDV